MGNQTDKASANKWMIVTMFAIIATTVSAGARKAASDPAIAPVAHTVSATATLAVWANWFSAIVAVPLAILAVVYYVAVIYESKLYQKIVERWNSRKA